MPTRQTCRSTCLVVEMKALPGRGGIHQALLDEFLLDRQRRGRRPAARRVDIQEAPLDRRTEGAVRGLVHGAVEVVDKWRGRLGVDRVTLAGRAQRGQQPDGLEKSNNLQILFEQ